MAAPKRLGLFKYSLEWFLDVSLGKADTLPFLGTGHSQFWEDGEVFGENLKVLASCHYRWEVGLVLRILSGD